MSTPIFANMFQWVSDGTVVQITFFNQVTQQAQPERVAHVVMKVTDVQLLLQSLGQAAPSTGSAPVPSKGGMTIQ